MASNAFSQTAGSAGGADSAKATAPKVKKRDPGPRRATIMSAVVPGLGQIYNRKYWKLPIIYGLGGVLIIFADKNFKEYDKFKTAYSIRSDTMPGTTFFNDPDYKDKPQNLKLQRDGFLRIAQLDIILLTGLYVLQIVDAHVDAHLKNFEINDNLSLQVAPQLKYLPQNNLYSGVSLNLKFKSKRESF
jgi:hypothetical protein